MARNDVTMATQADVLSMIDWIKTLSVFNELSLPNQLFFIKRFSARYLTLENGFFTALNNRKNIYQICTGSYMPRDASSIEENSIPSARVWRQKKLWTNMVTTILDQVVAPLKLYKLLPEEMLVLKVIILFDCGNHNEQGGDEDFPIEATSRKKVIGFKNRLIEALFVFYKSTNYSNFAERFGNLILMISGVSSAANVLLETYQIMRLFNLASFDSISQQLLFNTDEAQ